MTRDVTGTAAHSLRQQVEIFGRGGVSLTSLWRAVGRPSGHDPGAWSLRARPLIAGYARYAADVDPSSTGPVVWAWTGDDGEPWRIGDLMARGDLAQVYAAYLDAVMDGAAAPESGLALRRGC
ncbi:MAG TPA: hypothetical protein VGH33_02075 [Isosphaeraceae bacterium]|jgi:hypothetical protein